jgi:AmpD protein
MTGKNEKLGSQIGDDGWLAGARHMPSPNQDSRPAGAAIDLVVIHAISLPPGEFGGDGVIQLFSNALDPDAHPYYADIAGLKVSAHFFIRRDGELIQCVPVTARAWHAGLSSWQGRERCNDFSVGVELEGDDQSAFENAQYLTLQKLLVDLQASLPIKAVTSHSHIAPGRKTDPGTCFDWAPVKSICPKLLVQP